MTQEGFIFICPAGNDGPKYASINYPGSLDYVITVGSFKLLDETLSQFSSKGPRGGC